MRYFATFIPGQEKQGPLHRRLDYFLILNNANAENRHF